MTFTAVVTVHDDSFAKILANLFDQTRTPGEVLVYMSGSVPLTYSIVTPRPQPHIELIGVQNFDDWGHEKRAMGLARATGDVIGFFNHDDEYEPTYIEDLLGEIEQGADVAYCNWSQGCREGVGDAEFRMGSSTSGNWIARTSIVRAAGYRSRQYSADGLLINDVREKARIVSKVHKTLYHHNP